MRDTIIHKSAELFINFGFKSVTMDDIANQLGISKKTIYQHFANKTKLIEATTNFMFDTISCGIDEIRELDKNPIAEIYEIKQFVMEHLKNEKSSPQYQLQKYYPKIFSSLKLKQFEIMQDCVTHNLHRGVALGLYREHINIQFISRIYFNCMIALKDQELFPLKDFSMSSLMDNYLDYHLRGICTIKGLELLNTNTSQPTNNTPL
ncbi:TetR/AcrR family transcriptional regulator [Subsaximicrobium wynnwilliamsii]|jgi:AcrR family transcriptional regulator|uniref:TetR/AcrR family transcriptional regulator n=1 Tax=Subsaximicrobium wynnwilliamsii TaxID=291179 RepID=A0A5C6ZCN7_9FLAO|nr:TetR/AcrR family transcriptional regulator [Subsaximicrobium wynnwilliamsii]TXD81890.1 TetR/AcrR family transcriptional regulator [Subsaximicrobium wynnwilliamsii]TXD86788.1 TetR/AcrR family transcriptional regulator [Subsaximicrobium wynnwilliamsii]TXE01341.1 TetR/AcrR family transcriptional regulator [Subsaximicrobium wynnwilliamsii]